MCVSSLFPPPPSSPSHTRSPQCAQDVLRQYLHHLQHKRADGSYVYMFSENQATAMMPRCVRVASTTPPSSSPPPSPLPSPLLSLVVRHSPHQSYTALPPSPSYRDAPDGMSYPQFLNVMFHVHKDTGWSAQRIIEAFEKEHGHYGSHPGQPRAAEPERVEKQGCCTLS